jgi:DNA primase
VGLATRLPDVSRRGVDVGRLLESLNIDARKRGDQWFALCPNPEHDDHKPTTWSMRDEPGSPKHALHGCWSCGYRGDAIGLTKDRLGVGYHAAVCWIDEFAPAEEGPVTARVEIAEPRVFRLPAGVVDDEPLADWPTPFRRYVEGRGIPDWQAERWGIGYALEGRLSGRVVLPARNMAGRLLGYTARAIGGAQTRYLHPSRDEGADPAAVFGEEHWGPAGHLAVAEGAFDAMACERVMHGWAIAALGGASHAEDPRVLMKLGRFEEIVVATDADDAGDRAYEAIATGLAGKTIVRARPPAGFDANKLGPAELRGMIERARRR